MNKAFVRENDADADRCPSCGSQGRPVTTATLDAWIVPEQRGLVGATGWFCPFARCDVAYFDSFERTAPVTALVRPVFPKSPSAAICGCFGLSLDDIEADLDEGTPARIRELVARSKSADARCSLAAADGCSCVAEVQRLYFKRLEERRKMAGG